MKKFFYFLSFTLLLFSHFRLFAQPTNDNACDAQEVVLDAAALIVNNLGATVEAGEENIVPPGSTACDPGTWCDNNSPTGGPALNHSVWFKFTAPTTTAVNIDICGSTFDTQLALYRATDCADFSSYTLIWATDDQSGCGNDPDNPDLSSTIRIECLEAGAEYMVVVDDWQNDAMNPVDTGDVVIAITTEQKIDPGVNMAGATQIIEPHCPGGAEGSIDISLISGVEPITYAWSNGATTQDISGLTAGTYQVTVTDFCATSTVASFGLEDPTEPQAIAFAELPNELLHPTHCGTGAYGGQISVPISEGVGPFSYAWSNGDTLGLINNLPDGSYTVTVTDNCDINTAVRTYHVGMEAGDDFDFGFNCQLTQIGVDHSLTGGDVTETTYSTDQSTGSGIACRGGGNIARSATWRSFDLANDFGVTNEVNLDGVEVFITSNPNFENAIGVRVKFTVYIASSPLLDDPNLQLIVLDSLETFIPELPNYTSYIIPLKGAGLGPTDILAVKVETLTASGDGHRFDFASNETATTQTTYITSDDCGIATPITLASIGFAQQMVMNLFLSNGSGLTYEWDGPVDDPTSPTPMTTTTSPATYSVTITDEACGITLTDQVFVSCESGATEQLSESSFMVSPNPSNGQFQLSGESVLGEIDCNIYNAHGQRIRRLQTRLGSGDAAMFDLSEFPKGVYWLTVATAEGTGVKRLIVQ